MISPRHVAALAYAKAGLPVFPCKVNSKEPATWHSFQDATIDPEQIDRWWAEADYNIGFEPDKGGWCVVDVDPKNGGQDTLRALLEQHGDPKTRFVVTPSGGYHLYFIGTLRPGASKLGPGLDIRGADSYVLVPPSVVDGRPYTEPTPREPVALPDWIGAMARAVKAEPRTAPEGIEADTDLALNSYRTWLAAQAPPAEGNASDTFYRYAAKGKDWNLTPETIAEELQAYYPAYALDDIAVRVANAFKHGQNDPGSDFPMLEYNAKPTAERFKLGEDVKVEQPADPEPEAPALFTTGKDRRERVVGDVEELIEGLIEKHCVTYLSGPGGSNKSRIAAHWGAMIHLGTPVYNRTVHTAQFIHVSYENGPDEDARRQQTLVRRLDLAPDALDNIIVADWKGKGPLVYIDRNGRLLPTPGWDALAAKCRDVFDHKFIVFDSSYNVFNFEGDAKINETAVQNAIDWLDNQMVALDATGLMLQHPSTAGMARGDNSGWSVAWTNRPRARLSLNPVKDAEGKFELSVTKRNNGEKGKPITLMWDDGMMVPYSMSVDGAKAYRACVELAITAADNGAPFNRRPDSIPTDIVAEIERRCGVKITKLDFQAHLAAAIGKGALEYRARTGHKGDVVGYYPTDPTSRSQ